MSKFYNNPINDKQMRANSINANKIVQIASDAQKVINDSIVSSVRFIGAGDPHQIKNAQEGDVIINSTGDIYLWCQGKWEIVGNNNYDFSMYTSGRSNGKTMKTTAAQVAKQAIQEEDTRNLLMDFHRLTMIACHELQKNKGINVLCTSSTIQTDPPLSVGSGVLVQLPQATHINMVLKTFTGFNNDDTPKFDGWELNIKAYANLFKNGSVYDKKLVFPSAATEENKYVLRIAYMIYKAYKCLIKGYNDFDYSFELTVTRTLS